MTYPRVLAYFAACGVVGWIGGYHLARWAFGF
jgi:hypothetical protein